MRKEDHTELRMRKEDHKGIAKNNKKTSPTHELASVCPTQGRTTKKEPPAQMDKKQIASQETPTTTENAK